MTPYTLIHGTSPGSPFIFASPHSGRHYPTGFRARSRLDRRTLRRSEDAYVDHLLEGVPDQGASLLAARFARAYLDLNREPYELDPLLFDGPLPSYVNCESERVSAGLGTIARVVATGIAIYSQPLRFDEAEERIEAIYRPYHQTLESLMHGARDRHGWAVLVDCHSMPTNLGYRANAPDIDYQSAADIVLGDRFGRSCAPALVDSAHRILEKMGYRVTRNQPYAGGFCTCHYGRPAAGLHALQIEIRRGLYMNEETLAKTAGFDTLKSDLTTLAGDLIGIDLSGSSRLAAE